MSNRCRTASRLSDDRSQLEFGHPWHGGSPPRDRLPEELFLGAGAGRFHDPEHFPWSIAFLPAFRTEGRIYAKYILDHKPDAKVGVLMEDSIGLKEASAGLEQGLGERAKSIIVKRQSFELTDPTIASQIALLQDSGAETVVDFSPPKYAVQAIRKMSDIGWKPLRLLFSASASLATLSARRTRQVHRHRFRGVPQIPGRSAMERRSGDDGISCVDGQILPGRR